MFKKLLSTSVISSVVATSLIVPGVTSVSAATQYNDVPASDPGYNAIQLLTDKKIVSGYGDNLFKPDGYISKVEALKVILNVASGKTIEQSLNSLQGSTGLKDIPQGTWYSPYMKFAQDNNIIDANLLKSANIYGTNDSITRAEFIHLFVKAFGVQLPTYEEAMKKLTFADIKYSSKYQWLVPTAAVMQNELKYVNGYSKTSFGPGNNITRREVAFIFQRFYEQQASFGNVKIKEGVKLDSDISELIKKAQANPTKTEDKKDPTKTNTTTTGGTVKVEVAEAKTTSVPKNAVNAKVNTLKLTASDKDVVIKSLEVKRSGLGNGNEITHGQGIRVIKDGVVISSASDYFNTSSNTGKIFFYPELRIPAKSTVEVDVVVNFNGTGMNSSHTFTLDKILTSDGDQKISPIELGTLQTTGYEVSSVTAYGNSNYTVTPGKTGERFAKFDLTPGNRDVTMKNITLTKTDGSDLTRRFGNVKLFENNSEVKDAKVTITSDKIQITGINVNLQSGMTKSFELRGDILVDGSSSTNTTKLKLDSASDIKLVEDGTGFDATASGLDTFINTVTFNNVSVQYSKSSTKDQTVAPGASNVTLFDGKVKTTTPMTVRKLEITPLEGTHQGAEAFANNRISIRINGQEVGEISSSEFGVNSTAMITKNISFPLEEGRDNTITLVATSIKNNGTTSGNYKFAVKLADVRDTSNNQVTLITNSLVGNKTTVQNATVSLRNATVAAPTNATLSNTSDVEVGRFALTPASADAYLTQVKVVKDASSTISSLGDIVNASAIELVNVNNNEKIPATVTVDGDNIIFSGLNVTLEKDKATNFKIVFTSLNSLDSNFGNTLKLKVSADGVTTTSTSSSSTLQVSGAAQMKTYTVGIIAPSLRFTADKLDGTSRLATFRLTNNDSTGVLKVKKVTVSVSSRSTAQGTLSFSSNLCLRDLGSSSNCGEDGTTPGQTLTQNGGTFTFDVAGSNMSVAGEELSKNGGYTEFELYLQNSPLWVRGDNLQINVQKIEYDVVGGSTDITQNYTGVQGAGVTLTAQ